MTKERCNIQIKIEKEYHDQFVAFCKKHGMTKAEALRFFIDTFNLDDLDEDYIRNYLERDA